MSFAKLPLFLSFLEIALGDLLEMSLFHHAKEKLKCIPRVHPFSE